MKSLKFVLLSLIPFVASTPLHSVSFNSPKFSFGYSNQGQRYSSVSSFNNGYGRSFGRNQGLNFRTTNFRTANLRTTNLRSGDIIADTRVLSNQVQSTLKQLGSNPISADIINQIINDKDNVCLGSLEEGIEAIEAGTKLVESAGDDIKALNEKINSFAALKDPATVVRAIADVLRLTEPAVTKITPENPLTSVCSSTDFGSLRSFASVIDELSNSKKLALGFSVRAQLKESARIISAVTTFLNQLKPTFSKFTQICTPDRKYNIQAISATGDLMVNLADLFGTLGRIQQGEQIRKGKEFVNKVVVSKHYTKKLFEFDHPKILVLKFFFKKSAGCKNYRYSHPHLTFHQLLITQLVNPIQSITLLKPPL